MKRTILLCRTLFLMLGASACSSEAGKIQSPKATTQPSLPTGAAGNDASGVPGPTPPPAAAGSGAPAAPSATVPTSTTAVAPHFVFGPYKDITVNANWNTHVISTKVTGDLQPLALATPDAKTVTWSFAVGECGSETWGGLAAADIAAANVSAWAAAKQNYIISTGGADGVFTCGTDAAFFGFLDRYMSAGLVGIDFDIEAGQTPEAIAVLVARVKAAQSNPKYNKLRYSFTIATMAGSDPMSLGTAGMSVMKAINDGGLTQYIVNLMTMNYGSALATNCTLAADKSCDMGLSAIAAAKNLHTAYKVPYNQIELTPMIGGNNTVDETFTLEDVRKVTAFVRDNQLAGLHYWSLDRDTDCAPGAASPTCNTYGKAGVLGYLKEFLAGLR